MEKNINDLVDSQSIGGFSKSNILIGSNSVSFNYFTVSELHYPEHIILSTTEDCDVLAITAWHTGCSFDAECRIPFFNRAKPLASSCRITVPIPKQFVKIIRKIHGWDDNDEEHICCGQLIPEEKTIIYKLG